MLNRPTFGGHIIRPGFLSVFHDEGIVSPQELHIDCMFPRQAATKRALSSILSANCTTFAVWMPKKIHWISVRFVSWTCISGDRSALSVSRTSLPSQ